jgi:hypothetical protein
MERVRRKIARIREHQKLVEGLRADRFTADPLYRGALLYYTR